MEPAKIMAAQPMCEQISQQRTEPGGSPYSEQLHKHSRRASGAANTMGTGTGGKPAPNSNEMETGWKEGIYKHSQLSQLFSMEKCN